MSLADDFLTDARSEIGEIGEDVIIRRVGSSDVTIRACVMGYHPRELIGTIAQGDVKIIALVDALGALLPLTTNDAVVVRGKERAIKAVDDNTRRIGGALIALEIQAGD